MDKVLLVIGVIRRGDGSLQSHKWIAGLLSSDVCNLSQHKIFNVRPFHAEVDDIALDIHTSAPCTALHLLRY